MICRPLYVDKIMAYTDTPFVKILTGVRRCGKSTILKMIMEKLREERNISENQIVSYFLFFEKIKNRCWLYGFVVNYAGII